MESNFLHITTTYLLPPLKSMPSAMYFCMTDCSNPLLVLASSKRLAAASLSTSLNL